MFAKGPQPGATPKADALKSYQKAYAHRWADGWVIYDGEVPNKVLAHGKTATQAWRNVEPKTHCEVCGLPLDHLPEQGHECPPGFKTPNAKLTG